MINKLATVICKYLFKIFKILILNYPAVCPAGTFRSNDVLACTVCPINSKSWLPGSAFCSCDPGYLRHPRDGAHMPCYKQPKPPANLTLLFADQTSAVLAWSPPVKDSPNVNLANQQFKSDIMYRVKCLSCNQHVLFQPSGETFNDTRLQLTNLEPAQSYTVQVHSLNGPSYSVGGTYTNSSVSGDGQLYTEQPPSRPVEGPVEEIRTEYAELTFTTESAILSTVFNVK